MIDPKPQELEQSTEFCANCSQEFELKDLEPDLDGYLCCAICLEYYGV